MIAEETYERIAKSGIQWSAQRGRILDYLIKHPVHPTVDDVYIALHKEMPTLSKTTVYNTLRLLSEKHAVQMITIDDHRVCYDGNIEGHVHFYCKSCGKVIDLMDEAAPKFQAHRLIDGNIVLEEQLYYKGICAECQQKTEHLDP